ncbi:MAG: amino acid ABC transporter substrate-binding protein [Nitrospirae bacterium]|nr:MAG: amino acid ABC transporter substrate-binding protein [Nitrospirota bacterium]
MNSRKDLKLVRFVLILGVLLCFSGSLAAAAGDVAGHPATEALRLGELMYRNGVLPSGKPLQAIAQGDLKLHGKMVTCANCHMKGGLGSFEGWVLTPPTNGVKLYAPLRSGSDLPGSGMARGQLEFPRPAYTDESLAKALRAGIDPSGRILKETMPRYILDDRDMEIFIYYLKNLSSHFPPGVTDNEVRFATVVTADVSAQDRDAMLEPLKAYIRNEWNVSLPVLRQLQRDSSYRSLSLDVWELKGPAATWREQLDSLHRRQPVFGLLGGISSGTWVPVHEFCEMNKIPCILPVTDLPAASGSDGYTLYFSKGYYQEGETAAKYLGRVFDFPQDGQIIQVYRDNVQGRALAQGFADVWKKLGTAVMKNRIISDSEKTGRDFWKGLSAAYPKAALLLWLGPEDLDGSAELAETGDRPALVFVSSTMLKGALPLIPESIRDLTFITYPNRLPEEAAFPRSSVEQWLRVRNILTTDLTISSKMYFLSRMLGMVLTDMRGNFYQDYFLDLFDSLEDQAGTVAAYPRLSFGPGQRYASKGCYVVRLSTGPQPKIIRLSDWVIY